MLNIKLVIYIIFDRWCMYLHSYQDIHTYRYIHISCMYIYIHKYICTIMCKYVHVCNIYTQASTLGAQRFVRGSTCWKSNWAMTSSTRYTFQHTATHCNTLQHTATHCNTLQHTATHWAQQGTHSQKFAPWSFYIVASILIQLMWISELLEWSGVELNKVERFFCKLLNSDVNWP